jgi:large subunit ribosomal protein L35
MANYKMKSNSSAKKRFKFTASGRIKRKKAHLRHNLTKSKSQTQKRNLRKGGYIAESQEHQIRALLPYG